jgi:hypothetical protein
MVGGPSKESDRSAPCRHQPVAHAVSASALLRGEGKVQPVDQFGSHRSSPVAACCTSELCSGHHSEPQP